jgi:hypothetical protein
LAFYAGGEFAEFFVATGDGLAQLAVGLLALAEDEEVFFAVVAAQGFG